MNTADIRDYVVHRTSAEKLEVVLNDMAQVFDDIQPVFTGGRDWIIIASRPFEDAHIEHDFSNTDPGKVAERKAARKTVRVS